MKKFDISYQGTILSINANGKIVVRMETMRDNTKKRGFKDIAPLPMILPLLDTKIEAIVGHPVCLDISDEGDYFKVVIDIPGYSGESKIAKKTGSS